MDTEQRPKKKRSRFGCNTCRARKVKCDERPNGCANCEKLQLKCSGYGRPESTACPKGRRTYRSCNGCRIARTKCSGEHPICAACREKNLQCSYRVGSAPSTALSQASDNEVTGSSLATTARTPSSSVFDSELPWLSSTELPARKHVRVLVTYYFQNFHPLRCFAFIHKPTFLRQLDDQLASNFQQDALLHIMCTLGAQFYALEHSDTVKELPDQFILFAGSSWAKTAQRLLLERLDKISIESLMTAQLLYDYALRMANFTQAFMLSSLMARMTQALQINLEYSTDLLGQSAEATLSPTLRESRRRLMWSCYVTDVLCSSGVNQLALVHEKDLNIQLPCNDWNFLHEQPCITRTLAGSVLDFVPAELIPSDLDGNMGMLAYFVQQTEMRKRVLGYIKRLDTAKMPWLPDSEFAIIDGELRSWYESLPSNLEFTTSTIYMRKESSQLGALCLFHCAYHQTLCDLYRIGTPVLYKLRNPFHFPPERSQFLRELQWALFKEARTLAAIIAEGERHGPRIIGDTWLPTITYDSIRIMLFYLTQVTDAVGLDKRELILSTIPYLQSNLRALKTMKATNAVADGLTRAAETMLAKLGVDSNNILPLPNVILDDPYLAALDRSRRSAPGSPPQSAPDHVLNPLSIFRMARKDIPEGHSPELVSSRMSNSPMQTFTTPPRHAAPLANFGNNQGHDVSSDTYGSAEGFSFDLDSFFTPDLSLDWMPADMAIGSSLEGGDLLSWIGASQPAEYLFENRDDGGE